MSESLKGLKILIVEDDQFLRDLFSAKFKKEESEIIESEDGEDALRKMKERKPDLVLLDIVLPKMDGFEVLKKAKKDSEISKIPIILLTNLGKQDDVDTGIKLGAVSYIIKANFTPGEVVKRVQGLLKKSKL